MFCSRHASLDPIVRSTLLFSFVSSLYKHSNPLFDTVQLQKSIELFVPSLCVHRCLSGTTLRDRFDVFFGHAVSDERQCCVRGVVIELLAAAFRTQAGMALVEEEEKEEDERNRKGTRSAATEERRRFQRRAAKGGYAPRTCPCAARARVLGGA